MDRVNKTLELVKGWEEHTAATKLMALILAGYADKGNFSPRIRELGDDIHAGNVPIFRTLKKLRDAGFISWKRIAIEGRGTCNNEYTLHFLGEGA